MPPPPKQVKRPGGPPARVIPLPCGKHVRAVEEGEDARTFMLVTVGMFGSNVLGPRLDRGRGMVPTLPNRGLARAEVDAAFKQWENFVGLQKEKLK
jgi:hypothetical protein